MSELIGPLGGKLHTGRSRNDQVATDMRLWLLDEIKAVEDGLKGLIRVMVERADKEVDILMPGYTHLQVTLSFFESQVKSLTPNDSVDSQSGGLISYSRMPSLSAMILNDFNSSFLESRSCP